MVNLKKKFFFELLITIITFVLLSFVLSGSKIDIFASSNSKYPIKIKNKFGTTVIRKKPKRIATIEWGNQDVPLALGKVPVGFSEANFGSQNKSGILPWTQKRLNQLGEKKPNVFKDKDGLDYEAIAKTKPDVILAAYSGISKKNYQTLSKIAPVVSYPKSPWSTNWKQQVLLDSEGMGEKKQGKKLIKKTDHYVKKGLKKYPQIKNKTAIWANFSGKDLSKFQIYTPHDSRSSLLKEFSLKFPKRVKSELNNKHSFQKEFSSEKANILKHTDVIISYGNKKLYNILKKDPVLGKIPAIKRGSVVMINYKNPIIAAGTPTPLSIQYTLNQYLGLLNDAINKLP